MANTHSIDLEASSTQWLSHADHASIPEETDFTLECWFKSESLPSDGNQMGLIAHLKGAVGQRGFSWYITNTGGVYSIDMQIGTTAPAGVNRTINTGTWYHVAAVFDNTANSCEIFWNGSSAGTITGLTSAWSSDQDLQIGANGGDTPANYFDGLIDEARIWSDKRTSGEISANYDIETADTGNLVGYWQLDNDLTDTSGVIGTLTNNNAAVFSTDDPFTRVTSVSDTSTITDAIVVAKGYRTSVSDSIGLTGAITNILAKVTNVLDTVSISDSILTSELWSNQTATPSTSWANQTKN